MLQLLKLHLHIALPSAAAHVQSRILVCARASKHCSPCHCCTYPCPPPAAHSWIATPGHSPGHISVLHRPSGTVIAGDALFNVFPSASFASGIEGLVTRPLGFLAGRAARLVLGPAQAALSSVLGGRWPVPVPAALNATLGSLSTERLTSGAVRRGGVCVELGCGVSRSKCSCAARTRGILSQGASL